MEVHAIAVARSGPRSAGRARRQVGTGAYPDPVERTTRSSDLAVVDGIRSVPGRICLLVHHGVPGAGPRRRARPEGPRTEPTPDLGCDPPHVEEYQDVVISGAGPRDPGSTG